jgi:hypothetical protein
MTSHCDSKVHPRVIIKYLLIHKIVITFVKEYENAFIPVFVDNSPCTTDHRFIRQITFSTNSFDSPIEPTLSLVSHPRPHHTALNCIR